MANTLGERVKQARLALGLTQRELAGAELHKSFICLLEKNGTRPSPSTLERLARRLRQPLAYFLAGSVDPGLTRRVFEMLGRRGRGEVEENKYDAALGTFSELSALAAACGDTAMEMTAALGRGEALAGLWRVEEAKPYLDRALAGARTIKDPLVECRALAALGRVAHRKGQFPEAEARYSEALTLVGALTPPAPILHGEILLRRGIIVLRMGRLEEAEEAFTQGQRIFEHAQRPDRVGEALVDLGLLSYLRGEYDEALLRLERACVLFEQYEDLALLSWARNNLGMVLLEIGKPQEALGHFTTSLAIKRRLRDLGGECHTLTELARCHLACGEFARAGEYAEQAITRSHNGGMPDEAPRAQLVLAAIASAQGDARKAHRYLVPAMEHCEQAKMTLELVAIYRELARLASARGRHKEAHEYHDKAFDVLRQMNPQDAASAVSFADSLARHTAATFPAPVRLADGGS